MKVTSYSGQQLAQLDNPDPFAPPAWRSPVYHTPYWVITIVQLCRALFALAKFLARHPLLDLEAAVLVLAWRLAGWPGPVTLTSAVTVILTGWRLRWPGSFARFVGTPARGKWRRWHYQRRWLAVLTIARLVPVFRGQVLVPVLGKVRSTRYTDRVAVRLASGQARRLRRQSREPGQRVRRSPVPGPHCAARLPDPRVRPPRRARRDHRGAGHPRAGRPQGPGDRAAGGRLGLAGPVARYPPAGRRGHRRRERFHPVVAHPRHARPAPGRAGEDTRR